MITVSSLIFLVWSLLNVMIYIRIFNKKIGLMMPISFVFQTIICLLSGIFLQDVLFIPLVISIIGIIYSIYKLSSEYINGKDVFKEFIKKYLNASFFAYIALFVFVVVIERNRTITRTDDLMHWGLFVMDILETHKFPLFLMNEGYTWFHSDYPQFFPAFEAFFNYICMQGYVEWYSIAAIVIFSLSLFLPIFDGVKGIFKNIALFLVVILVGFCVSDVSIQQNMAMFYDGLSVDYVLGIMTALGLYFVYKFDFKDEKEHIILISLLLAIVNTKQMAICFYILIVFALLVKQLINKNKISWFYLVYFVPLLSFVHWNSLVSSLGQKGQFQLNNMNLNLIGIYNGTAGEVWQTDIINYYIDSILFRDLHHFMIPMSYFVMVMVLLVVNTLLSKLNKDKYLTETNVVLLIGSIGYAFALLLTYVYLFGESEGSELASFERYVQTYTILMISFILMYYSEYYFNKKNISTLMLFVMFVIMFDTTSISTIKQNEPFADDDLTQVILEYEKEFNDKEKLLVISQFVDDFDTQYERNVALRYYMAKDYGRKALANIKFVSIAETGRWSDLFTELVNIKGPKEFIDYINNFDFIYHYKLNDYYIKLFDYYDDDGILNNRLYRIKNNNLVLIDHINTIESTR